MTETIQKLTLLVKAILSRVQDREGYVTKTKLFKYLYLIDVEWYRHRRCQFTNFQWIFHHYGPWSQDCEGIYTQLASGGDIHVQPSTHLDLDTEFVKTSDQVEFEKAMDDLLMESIVRKIVDTWADRRLSEMLDYVYFRTEPMQGAERGEPLDFTKVELEMPVSVPATTSPSTGVNKQKTVERMRDAISEKKMSASTSKPYITPPIYDDVYLEALHSMKDDDD